MNPFVRDRFCPLWCALFVLLVAAQAERSAWGQPASEEEASQAQEEKSEVEYLLELRDAERNWDRSMTAAVKPESTRVKPAFNPDKLQGLLEASQLLLQSIDNILASPRIQPLRKEQIKLKKLSFLYDAIRINSEAFKPSRDALLVELYDQARREEGEEQRMAAMLAAYKLREDFIDTEKSAEKVQAALDEFHRAYPRSNLILSLYFRRAENLEEAGDIAGTLEVLRRMQTEFRGDPRLAILESRINRLELIGQPAEFAGPTLDGAEYNIADHAGKVVLIDFWASWCSPCLKAFPDLKRLQQKYQDKGLVIVSPTLDDKREDVTEALERNPATWPIIFFEPKEGEGRGFENPLASKLNINYIPARFLVGKDGKYIGTNYVRLDVLEWAIAKALGLDAIPPDPVPTESAPPTEGAQPPKGENEPGATDANPASDPVLTEPKK